MSAVVTITENPDGWTVKITEAENAVIKTVGKRITVAVNPDDDDVPTPLDVTFETSAVGAP